MSEFKLRIVASNRVFFDGYAKSLVIPIAEDGQKGFLPNHENTVAPIEFGEMKIVDNDDNTINAFVGSGFIEFFDNEATIVCVSAELPDEIDERRAREAKERAEEELRQKRSVVEYYQSQRDLSRAMERLKVKNRHSI